MSKQNWQEIHNKLIEHYRLKTLTIALKYYKSKSEMLAVEGLAVPEKLCTPCLAVGQAVYLGQAVAVTDESFNTDYCRGVNGFIERDEKWHSAEPYLDRWSENLECAQAHHKAMRTWDEKQEGFAVAPIKDGIIDDPDACLMYVTPEQAFWILAGTINVNYKMRTFTFIGESTCNDSWLRTAMTGEPGLALGSNGERVFGGLKEGEVILTLTVDDVLAALEGAENMREGREYLAYPMAPYSAFGDISCTPNPAFEGF